MGRSEEIALLERLLQEADDGRGRALVVEGDAGVGKTALLDHVVERAAEFDVTRVAGVESEMELPYAALNDVCAPLLADGHKLPEPQLAALEGALGLRSGPPPEPVFVGLATLGLLSDESATRPRVVVVDDAQWLDDASAQALAFVARRVLADRVALLFGARTAGPELIGLPTLRVEGLGDEDARALLACAANAPLDPRVRDRLISESGGNPLALLELPRGLRSPELAVGFGVPSVPLAGRIEASFRERLESLPAPTRKLLLIAALEAFGEHGRAWAAAARLGIPTDSARPALVAGLLDDVEPVRFRHPLVRCAICRSADRAQQREAHRALADVTDPAADPDRRAWHLAQAAAGPDEAVAGQLEESAGRAQERGGVAAAAAFLELAAELSCDRRQMAERRLLAAVAKMVSGDGDRAQLLVERSLPELTDPATRATAMRIMGAIRFSEGRGGDTPGLLFDAAVALREESPAFSRETLMESFEAAYWAGALTSATTVMDVAVEERTYDRATRESSPASLLLAGYGTRLTEGYVPAVEWWRRAIDAFAEELDSAPTLQWHSMMLKAAGDMFEFATHRSIALQWVRIARDAGALASLPEALTAFGWCEILAGRISDAELHLAEALEIAAITGGAAVPGTSEIARYASLIWSGEYEAASELAGTVAHDAASRGQGLGITLSQYGRTILELGYGHYEAARTCALAVLEQDPPYFGSIGLADAIEATVHCGDLEAAQAALERLTERAQITRTHWGLGLQARGEALLAPKARAAALYEESIAHLKRSGVITEYGRSRLLYGEWMRRGRERRAARIELRMAHDVLQAIGANPFARRARLELLATGEHARARVVDTADHLTPQERQVARLAVEGRTNAAIGSELFISPHTVAHHLRNAFRKLGISRRIELAGKLSPGGARSAVDDPI